MGVLPKLEARAYLELRGTLSGELGARAAQEVSIGKIQVLALPKCPGVTSEGGSLTALGLPNGRAESDSLETMTPEQRRERALKASHAAATQRRRAKSKR